MRVFLLAGASSKFGIPLGEFCRGYMTIMALQFGGIPSMTTQSGTHDGIQQDSATESGLQEMYTERA